MRAGSKNIDGVTFTFFVKVPIEFIVFARCRPLNLKISESAVPSVFS